MCPIPRCRASSSPVGSGAIGPASTPRSTSSSRTARRRTARSPTPARAVGNARDRCQRPARPRQPDARRHARLPPVRWGGAATLGSMQQKVRGFVALALVAAGGALWAVTPASAAHDHTLNAKGAVLQPSEVVSKPLSGTQGCQVLLDTGTGDCAVVNAAHGTLVFTVEAGPYQSDVLVERPWIVRVYRV